MANQEEGWPLGLQPVNVRVGLVRNRDFNGSISFNTLITGSPTSSTDSSSDLDTQSTGSFFRDKSITLGNLIGISSILELSRRSTRGRIPEPLRNRKSYKSKTWFFSLCSKPSTDAVSINNTSSLGHFLEAERRGASSYGRNPSPGLYGPDDFAQVPDPNSLFVEGHVAPPQSSSWLDSSNGEGNLNRDLFQEDRDLFQEDNGDGSPILFSCLCGH